MAISVVSFSFSSAAQPEARGPNFLLCAVLSATSCLFHLISNSSDFQSSPSYIIVQSPTQSLEWYVRSSSSGNNCHELHRSFSSGASVYEWTMGFYLVPYFQPSPPTRFLLITAIGMCHFLLEWHVWPGRRSIYNIMKNSHLDHQCSIARCFSYESILLYITLWST